MDDLCVVWALVVGLGWQPLCLQADMFLFDETLEKSLLWKGSSGKPQGIQREPTGNPEGIQRESIGNPQGIPRENEEKPPTANNQRGAVSKSTGAEGRVCVCVCVCVSVCEMLYFGSPYICFRPASRS